MTVISIFLVVHHCPKCYHYKKPSLLLPLPLSTIWTVIRVIATILEKAHGQSHHRLKLAHLMICLESSYGPQSPSWLRNKSHDWIADACYPMVFAVQVLLFRIGDHCLWIIKDYLLYRTKRIITMFCTYLTVSYSKWSSEWSKPRITSNTMYILLR